jgi:hypothetical protein
MRTKGTLWGPQAAGLALLIAAAACGGGTEGESVGSAGGKGGGTGGAGGKSDAGSGSAGAGGISAGGSTGLGGSTAGGAGGQSSPDAPVSSNDVAAQDAEEIDTGAADARPVLSMNPVPGPWMGQDIGTTGVPGGSGRTRNTFQVRGSGGDVWAEADAFHFLSRSVTGDVEIVAKLAAFERTSTDAKAGLMFRDSTAVDARNVFMLGLPSMTAANGTVSGKGSRMQYRDKRIDNTTYFTDLTSAKPGVLDAPPLWLRLTRKGSLFEGFVSADGLDWRKDGEVMIPMPPELSVGLAVTSHANNNASLASFEGLRVTALTDATWGHAELGTVGGYAAGAPRRFDMVNAGRGIANDEDGITFVHRNTQHLGDVEITGRVTGLTYSGTKPARIGLMLRGMLRGDARMAAFLLELGPAGQKLRLQRRAQDNGNISTTEDMTPVAGADGGAPDSAAPVADAAVGDAGASGDGGRPGTVVDLVPTWIKLVRVGHRFVGLVSPDGRRWRVVIDLPNFVIATNAFLGVALTSGTEGGPATGRIENVTIVSPPETDLPERPDAGADAAKDSGTDAL